MVTIIQQLLLTNNCVIIPGFGALIANYQPAEVRLFENKIIPPFKNIAFNSALKNNDGILVNAVMHHYVITYNEAENKVNDFGKNCHQSLDTNDSLIFNEIGKFSYDLDKRILFQSYNTKNYLLNSYGLVDLTLTPILRLKDNESEIKEIYQRILHPELLISKDLQEKTTSNKLNLVIAFIAILFIVTTFSLNIRKSSNLETSFSSIFPINLDKQQDETKSENLKPIKKEQPSAQIPEKVVVNGEVFPTAIPKNEVAQEQAINEIKNQKIVKNSTTTKSYIVVGACLDIKMAEKIKASAIEKNYETIITKDINRYRITIEVDNKNVNESLKQIQANFNAHAWIYCMKCNL
jgi:hypothetical protein